MKKLLLYNGQIIDEKEIPVDFWRNRAYYYGDAFFESIRVHKGKIQLFDLHFERIIKASQVFQIQLNFDIVQLKSQLIQLIEKSKLQEARIRLQITRTADGFYNISNQNSIYLAEISPLSFETRHLLAPKNLIIYHLDKKEKQRNSAFKAGQVFALVQAGIFASKNNADDAIILNQNNEVIETTTANIYLVKNNTIITPALDSGGVNGIFRTLIFQNKENIPFKIEEKNILIEDLLSADEVFVSNAIAGVQSISKIDKKEFQNNEVAAYLQQLFIIE